MSKVFVIGDALVSSDTLEKAVKQMNLEAPIEVVKFEWHSEVSKEEFQKYIQKIELNGPEEMDLPNGILDEISEADYLFLHYAPVPSSLLNKAKKLKMVGTCRGGMENVNLEAADNNNITVIHVIRNAEPVADFTLGLIYSETRNIAKAHHSIKTGGWEKEFSNNAYKTVLSNMKVGLLGLGYIGKLVAKKLIALNVEVIGFDPFVDKDKLAKQNINVQLVDSIEELFKTSDVVSLHARVTEENKGLVNKDLIGLMKPNSYIINTARPGLLNKEDLVDALKNKQIAGAALDVSWIEPIPEDDDLLKLDNITLTTHIAGDTVDAIPLSPYLLKNEVNEYLKLGISDMIVKFRR